MKILVLSGDLPATTRMAGCPRLFNLCRELAKEHSLTLAHFPQSSDKRSTFDNDPDNKNVFSSIEELPTIEQLGFTKIPWWRKQLHRAFGEPYFSQRLRAPKYVKKVKEAVELIVRKEKPNLIYVNGYGMFQYITFPLAIPLAIDLCDCLHLLCLQEARLLKGRKKIAMTLEAVSLALWARWAARKASLTIVVSKPDEDGLLRLAPEASTAVIPIGVDLSFFSAPFRPHHEAFKPRLIFTGVMGYHPNADAAYSFAKEVFPEVRRSFPEAEFWIVGACPPPEIEALREIPGIEVTGAVPDIRDRLNAADIFVSPLRYGTGIKNKILTSLAMELPTIATRISLSGMPVIPETHVLVADSAEEFVQAIKRLKEDIVLTTRLRQKGRELVTNQFSWAVQGALLSERLHLATEHYANQCEFSYQIERRQADALRK